MVQLGLDPSDFDKGQKAAATAFLKTRDQAKSAGQDVEKSAKGMADGIDRVTKSALALFGVLVGAHGLTDFLVSVTNTDAAIGRLSTNLGISTSNLQQWQAAASRMGGSAEGMTSSIQTANSQIVGLRTSGTALPTGIARIFASAGMSYDPNWTTQQYLLALAQAANKDKGTLGASTVSTLLGQSGFTSDFTNLALARGGAGLQSYLNTMPVVSDDTIKRLQDLQTTWGKLQQTLTQFFSTLLADFEPALKPFLQDFQNFANILVGSEPTLAAIAKDAASIANSLGGWRVAIEALVALWTGGKLLGMLSALKGLFGLGGAAAGAEGAAGGGVLGTVLGAIGATGLAGAFGGAAAIWLSSAGAAGAGEGDRFRAWRAGQAAKGYTPGAVYDPRTGTYGAATKGWWTPARQAEAYSRLTKEAGLSDAGARALISRWMNVEAPGGPGSVNPSSGAFGIGQWLGARKSGIAGDTSFSDQLSHAIAELNGSESAAGRALRSAQTAQQGAIGASMYERAENYDPSTGADAWTAKTLAGMSAVVRAVAMSAHSAGASMSSHVTLNGPIHIHTQATDAGGIAKDLHGALKRAAKVRPANTGMA